MRWQIRCLLDRVKGALPAQEFLRETKRKVFGFQPNLGRDRWAIEEGLLQVQWVRAAVDLHAARVLELGSGWQPIIPLLFSMAGARSVVMTDVKRLCHATTFHATIQSVLSQKSKIAGSLGIPELTLVERLEAGATDDLEENLRRLAIEYLAPCDVLETGLPPESIDVVVSRAVLEHLPPDTIRGAFREASRILRPGGVMCHFVDSSDHWAHRDKEISRINFLKYSDEAFRWIQWNGLNYQNRLRHPEYLALIEDAGFRIEREERTVDGHGLSLLGTFPLAPRFRSFSKEDLATTDSYCLAVKPAG